MLDPTHPIAELLREDKRYAFEAYVFVFEALGYAQKVLGMGSRRQSEQAAASGEQSEQLKSEEQTEEQRAVEQHVSGQELCEAIRRYALHQYGYMAKTVLNSWGVHTTGDIGEIVFNLIRIGQMRKTPQDRREDFDDVYDFETAFRQDFKITPSD